MLTGMGLDIIKLYLPNFSLCRVSMDVWLEL